jgi:ferredoxin-NADP reductase
MFAGGIGITPMMSIYQDLAGKVASGGMPALSQVTVCISGAYLGFVTM